MILVGKWHLTGVVTLVEKSSKWSRLTSRKVKSYWSRDAGRKESTKWSRHTGRKVASEWSRDADRKESTK